LWQEELADYPLIYYFVFINLKGVVG
jgi:hypothetical protein